MSNNLQVAKQLINLAAKSAETESSASLPQNLIEKHALIAIALLLLEIVESSTPTLKIGQDTFQVPQTEQA